MDYAAVAAPVRVRGEGEQLPADEPQVLLAEAEDGRFTSAAKTRARRSALAMLIEPDGRGYFGG